MSVDKAIPADRSSALPAPEAVRDFLRHLQQRMTDVRQQTLLPEPPDTDLHEVDPHDDLPGRFSAAAEDAGCRVHRATEENWVPLVQAILRGLSVRRVVVEAQPGTALTTERAAALCNALEADSVAAVNDCDDETLFTADAAITGVLGGTAETGTILCASGPSSARGSSLIPPLHVALVAESQLAADLFDTFDALSRLERLPANINLITGPSKTADIEGVLVTGVHGPGEVHVVLLTGE